MYTKHFYSGLLFFVCISFFAATTKATTVFNNSLNNTQLGWTSMLPAQQIASDFTLGSAATVNGISWFGFLNGGGNDTFRVRIFNDTAGTPQNNFFYESAITGFQTTDSGQNAQNGTNDIFVFSGGLINPVLLQAGTRYWISIVSENSNFIWSHSFSTTGIHHRSTDSGNWSFLALANRSSQAFSLAANSLPPPPPPVEPEPEPEPIPEPASWILLALTLVFFRSYRS